MKPEFSIYIYFLKKTLEYQIEWKFVQWEPICSMRGDGEDEVNTGFSQFCERT